MRELTKRVNCFNRIKSTNTKKKIQLIKTERR